MRSVHTDASILVASDSAADAAQYLDLEITESLVMQDIEANTQKLNVIREMGVEVAIDDAWRAKIRRICCGCSSAMSSRDTCSAGRSRWRRSICFSC